MLLAEAEDVRVGTVRAEGVYAGDTLIWPSGFDPTSLTGLMVWLDAAQLGMADGAAVSPWPDLSGTGHHGNIVGSPAPVLRHNTLNGKPVVRFKINEGRVRGSSGLDGAGVGYYNATIVYVTRLWGPNVGRAFAGRYPAVNLVVGFHTSLQDWMYDNGNVNAGVGWTASPGPWKLYGATMSHNGTIYESRFYKNGVKLGETAGGTGLNHGYNLSGYSETGTEETMDCEVAELLIWNRKLPDADRIAVEDYLRTKWGLT